MEEIFHELKPLGFPDYYISKLGRVLSYKTSKEGKILKPRMDRHCAYYRVGLRDKDKERKFMLVHRLLALTFIPNDNNLPCVDHIDRDKTNNKLENLRWVTHATNTQNSTRRKNNKQGHKHIRLYVNKKKNGKEYPYYIVEIERNGTRCNRKRHIKIFKKLEDAIKHRDEYLTNLGEEIID